jgi:uncharacterized protein YlxP (DUF503 family)
MFVGIIRAELRIHGASSLKEKRAVLRRLKDRTRSRHNISVAEVDHQELRQRATLGFAAVGHSKDDLARLFSRIRDEIENLLPGGLTGWDEEVLS